MTQYSAIRIGGMDPDSTLRIRCALRSQSVAREVKIPSRTIFAKDKKEGSPNGEPL